MPRTDREAEQLQFLHLQVKSWAQDTIIFVACALSTHIVWLPEDAQNSANLSFISCQCSSQTLGIPRTSVEIRFLTALAYLVRFCCVWQLGKWDTNKHFGSAAVHKMEEAPLWCCSFSATYAVHLISISLPKLRHLCVSEPEDWDQGKLLLHPYTPSPSSQQV